MSAPNASAAQIVVENAVVDYVTPSRTVRALDGATLRIPAGQRVGVVGESGSGKSTLGLLLGRLLPSLATATGAVDVAGSPVLELTPAAIARLRRSELAFIAQDAVGSLNPTLRIGRQLSLAMRPAKPAPGELVAMLERVRIRDPERVLRLFPHEISGGMAQRIAIAMAMHRAPRILVADEPTAALDTQVRDEVTRLVFELAREAGSTVLWLSHDLIAVAKWCDRIVVMYGGRVVEDGVAAEVIARPRHPYTAALAASLPARLAPGERLPAITGSPLVLTGPAAGCAFAPRCPFAAEQCSTVRPEPVIRESRGILCHRIDEIPALVAAGATSGETS
ncbi:ABC transporter ATP-binding protein [Herbiconiux sp.]|uniref:ABC transporter ATP-binding protein n=1 Tax=Herbiconiux sp. TaxID=1871186 RepID=UPI0025C103D0|nr:ABC transporter ATP-binding protein [Herbiconiux sp.]